MKRVTVGLCAAAVCVSALLAAPLFSQEAKKTETKTEVKTQVKAEAKKAKGRLPNNYGKLELSEDQVTKIYDIQAKYASEIETLQKQLEALRTKQMTEVKAVLTEAQSAKLAEMESAAKQKAADAKKAADASKASPAKAEAPKTETPKAEPAKTEAPKKAEPKK